MGAPLYFGSVSADCSCSCSGSGFVSEAAGLDLLVHALARLSRMATSTSKPPAIAKIWPMKVQLGPSPLPSVYSERVVSMTVGEMLKERRQGLGSSYGSCAGIAS